MPLRDVADRTIELLASEKFGVNSAESNPIRFNAEQFPQFGGVYVFRLKNRKIPRLRGESDILKIGEAESFRSRIRKYASVDVLHDVSAMEFIEKAVSTNGKVKSTRLTTLVLLSLLKEKRIVVDLYEDAKEAEFLREYVSQHWEVPPLNFLPNR